MSWSRSQAGPTTLLVVGTLALFVGSATGQHSDTYESYTASAGGTILTGQQGFYIPVPDSQDGKVYTYAGNTLGLPANPTGGNNFVGSTGGSVKLPVPFARSQQDVSYNGQAFRISYDVCVTKIGDPLTNDNIGSFSTQLAEEGAPLHEFGHIDLFTWVDPANASLGWDCNEVWYTEGGSQINENITALTGFVNERWYRRSTVVAYDTNRIVELSVTDLTTNETISVFPSGRYARGGLGNAMIPKGFRYFGGCSTLDCSGGNTLAWDNLVIELVPETGSCCFAKTGECLEEQSEEDCLNSGGVFNGIATVCQASPCFELGPDGWVVGAPINWLGDTCFTGDDCPLLPGNDERWELDIPWDQTWRFAVCGASADTVLYLGTAGCSSFVSGDDECLDDAEIFANITAGTYYLTLEPFDEFDCGEFLLEVSAPCPSVPDNPDCIAESGEECADEGTDPTNGGCNFDPPAFDDMACGETRCGTVGNFLVAGALNRDLDWYKLEITEPTIVTMTAIGSFQEVIIFLVQLNAEPGKGEDECTDTITITSTSTDECNEIATFSVKVEPGLYAPIIFPVFDSPENIPCGEDSSYEFTLTCSAPCVPSGDVNGSGCVDFEDILEVLANWGGGGPDGDADCSGVVDFADILLILAQWGDGCP